MKYAIVSDFDGTITTKDIGDFLLLYFNLVTPNEIEESYNFGIKIEQWMQIYFSKIKIIDKNKIKKAIKENVKIRNGFKELVNLCKEKKIPIEVVSGGVDLYIEEVFKNNNIEVSGYWGKFNNGDIKYEFLNGITLSQFKALRVKYYKGKGYKTIFCGDAANDYNAAKEADVCFASLRLKEILKNEGYKFYELDDFRKVMEILNASIY